MARTVVGPTVSASMTGTVKNTMTNDTTKSASGSLSLSKEVTFESGIELTQVDRLWQWKATLTSSATTTFDLNTFTGQDLGAGDANDITGQTMNPVAEIAAIMITNENTAGTAGFLEIEAGASNGWTRIGTHTVATGGALEAQGCLLKLSPGTTAFAVSSTNKTLKLTANGGSVAYKIALFGRHDDEESSSSSISSSSQSSSSSSSSSPSSSSQSSSSSNSSSSSSSSSTS